MDALQNQPESDVKHPVLTGEYAVFTPPMNDMINTIGDWIDQKLSGGYIFGPSRFGKSRTIKWFFRSVLADRFGTKIPLIVWIRPQTTICEGEFWNQWLSASKFEFFKPLKPERKAQARYLFKQQILTLAKAAHENYVSLVIDEAQDVTLNEWGWLLGLQNELDNEGIRLSVFSIGSHQIGFKPNYLSRTGNAHIVGRFFCVDARFHGISSVEQLSFVLNGYDVDSDWPAGTNTSYLKYFAPEYYSKNNRLSNHAADIWQSFNELLPKEVSAGVKKNSIEIPMLHVAMTIEQALRSFSEGKEWEEVTDQKNWLTMISKTGFTNHISAIRAPS